MEMIIKIFSEGRDLTALQMSSRGVVMFIIALILMRVSGRRSLGVRSPLDNMLPFPWGL